MRYCNMELFPRAQFNYTVSQPLNGKWILAEDKSYDMRPEWMLDFDNVYHYTWDALADMTEKAFKSKQPPDGDWVLVYDNHTCNQRCKKRVNGHCEEQVMAPCMENRVYAGKMLYMGQHSGDNVETLETTDLALHQIPASIPTNRPTMDVMLDVESTMELIKRSAPVYWPQEDEMLRLVLECNVEETYKTKADECKKKVGLKMPVFPFEVKLQEAVSGVSSAKDSGLFLKPGVLYTFWISLSMSPKYVTDFWGKTVIQTWNMVSDTYVTEQQLQANEKQQSRMRVQLTVNKQSTQLFWQYQYSIFMFMTSAGAWAGIWGIGLGFLGTIFKHLKPFGFLGPLDGDAVPESKQEVFEGKLADLKEKAAKRIKVGIESQYDGVVVDEDKVRALIVESTSSKQAFKEVKLKELFKFTNEDPMANLPDHVVELLDGIAGPAENRPGPAAAANPAIDV
jgi:hypothetical protein